MSRATDLRDAVITELTSVRSEPVLPFWTVDFPKEFIAESGPVIAVRASGRAVTYNMGPDQRTVTIDVGVFGVPDASQRAELEPAAVRTALVASCDKFDDIVEELIDLWSPGGVLAGRDAGLAEHLFWQIDQESTFDSAILHEQGIWAGVFALTYRDSRDE